MILINIETLSDAELRYIAKQENLDDWETLSREELIEELQDFYDEDDVTQKNERFSAEKYTRTLTSTPSDNVLQFPGVDPLPEFYNDTSIYTVLRDTNWVYVFWNLSAQKRTELQENGHNLILRNIATKADGSKESYDVQVNGSDDNWNIELPWEDCTYIIKLYEKTEDGEEKLCESKSFNIASSYYEKNPCELKNKKVRELVFAPLYSKDGTLINNRIIKGIIEKAGEAE